MEEFKTIEEALEHMKKDKLFNELAEEIENFEPNAMKKLLLEISKKYAPKDAELNAKTISVSDELQVEVSYKGTIASYITILEKIIREGFRIFRKNGIDEKLLKRALIQHAENDFKENTLIDFLDNEILNDEWQCKC